LVESTSRSNFSFEHNLFRKTGFHFSGSGSRPAQTRRDPVIKLNAKQRWIAGSSPAMTNEDVGEVTGSLEES
jgi:hypothetical protein